ncbi:glycosyltransferase [Acinetobacter baumannii]|uniref:glycosyltransferase n=2 Tax=Acinetobacter baumannii TaxID=470 RepID=UPI00222821C8|nr:glycosyltransferase [Acinetobacter baumannii]MCW3175535.1 hypothetical protein [Acinetobacter baumannii]MDC5628049.1 hypothetical protein [Acinetobacter baumannii]
MKKILLIDTTWPINSRTERFKNSFKKYFEVVVVAWNRGLVDIKDKLEGTYILNTPIGYGNQLKKLLKLPLFFIHIYSVCKKEKPDTFFASHWDSLICAVILKIIWNWKVKIIYDCLDLPTFSNNLIRKIIVSIEKFCLQFVSLTIFASRHFKPLYSKKLNSYIFENYPSTELLNNSSTKPEWIKHYDNKISKDSKNVAWIGVVRYFDIIENILLAIKDTNICFFVFGDGPDLDKLVKAVSFYKLEKQVFFFGRYRPSDLKYIYEKSDLVWAAYPTNDFNAVYAISNKYFECSFFEKKIILSKKTKMAESLQSNSSVVIVDEYSPNDIKEKLIANTNILVNKYIKYEKDITWEDQEGELINFLHTRI